MKSITKEPTDANLDEVAENDVLERNIFIAKFINRLASIEGNYSIAVDGRWGSGKTFFIKQTERVIQQIFRNKLNSDVKENPILCQTFANLFNVERITSHPMMTLYYDAWKHDNQQDALLSLVYEIAKKAPSINPQLQIEPSQMDKFRNGIITVAEGLINHFSGIDLEKFKNVANEIFQETKKQDDLELLLKDFFNNLLQNKNNRLVIFIDELDRCKPVYAVQLLERLKHYMTSDNIIFVFAVNIHQLQHTIKHYYGEDFEASSYLDRFFDLHVTLPVPDTIKRRETFHIGEYGSVFDQWCQILVDEFNFELREQIHFKESIEQSIHVSNDKLMSNTHSYFDEVNVLKFLFSFFAPLAIALKIKNINDYYSFIDGENIKALDILKNHLSEIPTDYFCKKFNIDSSLEKDTKYEKIKSSLDELYINVFKYSYYFRGNTTQLNKFEINYAIKDAFVNQISFLS